MDKHNKIQHTDNSGFTLVELLIAIVILAIIVVPLLHTFVTAARTNMKARTNLRVTTAAQDIMEGLKADTIEELSYQFNYPNIDATANPLFKKENEFHIIRRSLITGDIREVLKDVDPTGNVTYIPVKRYGEGGALTKADVTASTYSENSGIDYEFLGSEGDTGVYYFTMEDVTLQSATFDALIELDATRYRSGGSATELHNDEEVVDIMEMSNVYDAFYVEEEAEVDKVLQYMNIMQSEYTIARADLQRTITVDVKQSAVGANTVTKVETTCHYKASHAGYSDYEYTSPDKQTIFDNSSSKRELQDIYLFYFPVYESGKDEIIFNNNDKVPVTLHITKQEPTSALDLMAKEMNYHCRLSINEPGSTLASAVTILRTNLDTNLYQIYFPTPLAEISGIEYLFNATTTDRPALEAAGRYEDMSGSVKKDRIFDVKVHIYENGASANGFPEEQRLVTISGSKDN